MTNFDFISTKPFFMCNVGGIAINITDQEYVTIDVELATNSELLILARGVEYGYLLSNNDLEFEEYYTNLIGDISSGGSGVSSGQVQDIVGSMFIDNDEVDFVYDNIAGTMEASLSNTQGAGTTDATNITSGTLDNERLTTNLTQIGNETFADGEVVQSFGGVLQNASLASGATGTVQITNSAGQILFDAPYAKGPLNQKSGIFEDFITYSATVISPYLLRTVSGFGATTSIAPALSSGDMRNGVIVFSTGINSGGAAGAASGSLSSINFANIPEGGYEEVGFNFKIPILPDPTQQFLVNMGFGDSEFGGIPTDGAYISIGHTSGNAIANTISSSSGTTQHNIAISANTDTTARIRVSRISGVLYATYFINGTSMGAPIQTNIPSGASREVGIMFGINKFSGYTPRTIELDWIYYESFKPRTINY